MEDPSPSELETLDQEECTRLLREHRFGRVAFLHDGAPVILPVNYVYDEAAIVMRTRPGMKLDDSPLAVAAFEIDGVDPAGRWGWSVLAQGHAFEITSALDEDSARLRQLPVKPMAPGDRDHWLAIRSTRISGRRFGAPDGGPAS